MVTIAITGAEIIRSRLTRASARPSPNCRPASTDCGTRRASRVIQPVRPKISNAAPIITPLAASAAGPSVAVSRTAATAFIGCTGMGRR
jgi:hypothetical protein